MEETGEFWTRIGYCWAPPPGYSKTMPLFLTSSRMAPQFQLKGKCALDFITRGSLVTSNRAVPLLCSGEPGCSEMGTQGEVSCREGRVADPAREPREGGRTTRVKAKTRGT